MRWSRFFRRKQWDEERARELQAYLEIETDENITRGMTPEQARQAARRRLGNSTLIREEIYQMNSIRFLESIWQDVRYGVRTLAKSRMFTFVVIASLALGIGANTAIFSLIDAALLKMLPVKNPEQLVEFERVNPTIGAYNYFVSGIQGIPQSQSSILRRARIFTAFSRCRHRSKRERRSC
ncbi:MAG: permease prefix domain 1-containing protein [Bryobacteraceae bacterium]